MGEWFRGECSGVPVVWEPTPGLLLQQLHQDGLYPGHHLNQEAELEKGEEKEKYKLFSEDLWIAE